MVPAGSTASFIYLCKQSLITQIKATFMENTEDAETNLDFTDFKHICIGTRGFLLWGATINIINNSNHILWLTMRFVVDSCSF